HCSHIRPPSPDTFHRRQAGLIDALLSVGATAFIAEPGSTGHYFANVSLQDWRLSERPLLLVIAPTEGSKTSLEPRIIILTPKFEGTRARLRLLLPSKRPVEFVEWPEDENPYNVLSRHFHNTQDRNASLTAILDDPMRLFVADGLSEAGWTRGNRQSQIRMIRESKTEEEIEILKCANEVTLLAIRAVRQNMYIGMRESEANEWMKQALVRASRCTQRIGLALTIFAVNAALPHGGAPDKILERQDLITFDVGGTLHGYWSDVTRTFALPESHIPSRHLEIWNVVKEAQNAAFKVAVKGVKAKDVDRAARSVIEKAGFGEFFGHRLGIGIDLHESPYLRGDSQDHLAVGNTFSNEPGIYIEREIGVRLEDCFVVEEDGSPLLLTSGVGGPARSPWIM
ncbi:hypothetical protein M407DRAFT_70902, partial [Tulasnella calospora MUT 4182]